MTTITDEHREQIRKALPEIDQIRDDELRGKVTEALAILWRSSTWEDLHALPYLLELPEISWVQHTRFVAAGAARLADVLQETTGRRLDRDLILAAGLLHDGSKFQENGRTEAGVGKTELGRKLQHSVYAAHVAMNVGLPLDVVHAIVSHTPMAFTPPRLPEVWLVREADAAMAEALLNMSLDQYVSGHWK